MEQPIASLAQTIRRYESAWQTDFWETVLQTAARNSCRLILLKGFQSSFDYGSLLRAYGQRKGRFVVSDGALPIQSLFTGACEIEHSVKIIGRETECFAIVAYGRR